MDEVIEKLQNNRFVAVLGYSGSGKSSLMNCGVLPVICGGFITNAGADWNIVRTRPGDDPIHNLAASLARFNKSIENEDEIQAQSTLVNAILRSGPDGLMRVLERFDKGGTSNTLILIDQFEEVFRFRKDIDPIQIQDERSIYIEMLLSALSDTENRVYVALSMRSDFLGNCASFPTLNGLINESNYLVPKMTRDQKRKAIEGPIAVGNGSISERLVKRLLLEIGDDQDQLPIIQHAMMRAWNFWVANRNDNEPLSVRHYNAIGQLSGALSQHADEIYDQLSPSQKQIAETAFKLLTQKGQDNKGLRRPARVEEIARVAGVTEEEVIEVVDEFRKTGRSFLMPGEGVSLNGSSIIEISHESLMRIWVRLKNWVDEEYESSQMYIRLSEAATMYQIGQTGLWRPPDLQLALNWQKKQKPNRIWGQRYNEAFERAIVFLDTSRITYEAEQKNQELLQKRVLRRARIAALFMGLLALIAISFVIYGFIQQGIAEREALIAKQNSEKAVIAARDADQQRKNALAQTKIAMQARDSMAIINTQLNQTNEQLSVALQNESVAKQVAEREKLNAIEQSNIAEKERDRADSTTVEVIRVNDDFRRLLYLFVAQSMATKSLDIEDNDLQGLLAYQAYQFHNEFGGRKYDYFIYNGLYSALAQISDHTYNTVSVHGKNSVRSVTFPSTSEFYYTTGADGKVLKNDNTGKTPSKVLSSSAYRNKIIAVSKNDRYLVSGGDSSFVHIFDLTKEDTKPGTITVHKGHVNDIEFLPDNVSVITAGADNRILKVNVESGDILELEKGTTEYKVLDISESGKILAAGGLDGKVELFTLNNNNPTAKVVQRSNKKPVFAVAVSVDEKLLAYGDEDGAVILWDILENKEIRHLKSHDSRVTDIEFSPDGQLVATSSLDGTIHIWVLDELNELAIVLSDNDAYVWDIDFSPDSHHLLAACEDGEIRVWETDPHLMADKMCEGLKRNMTEEEWVTYAGEDIPFTDTCSGK